MQITSITPPSGDPGVPILINGVGFLTVPATGGVTINGSSVGPYNVQSDTAIACNVPYGVSSGTLTVTDGTNTANSASPFTITNVPETFDDSQDAMRTKKMLDEDELNEDEEFDDGLPKPTHVNTDGSVTDLKTGKKVKIKGSQKNLKPGPDLGVEQDVSGEKGVLKKDTTISPATGEGSAKG